MQNRSNSFGPVALRYRVPSWLAFKLALVLALIGLVFPADVLLHGPAGLIVETLFGPQLEYDPHGIHGSSVVVLGLILLAIGIVAAVTTAANPRQQTHRGKIATRDQELYIDDSLVVSRAVGTAIAEESDGYAVKVFAGAVYPRVTIATETWEQAQALVATLSAKESVLASFRIGSLSAPAGKVAFITGVALIAIGGILGIMAASPAFFLLGGVGFALMRMPATATVGADGIVLTCLGVESFIPFADITEVERDYGIVLHRRDGSTVRLRDRSGATEANALLARIEAVRDGALDTSMVERLLVRGQRTEAAWREDLRRLGAPTYREAAIERERLWEILSNGAADESARLGAAQILRARASEIDQERLRQIGAGIASPELRIAYDELLEDDEPEVDEKRRDTMRS